MAFRNLGRELLSQGRLFLTSSVSRTKLESLPLRTSFGAFLNTNKFRFYCSNDNKDKKDSNQWVTITFERHDGTLLKRKGKVSYTMQDLIGQNNPDFPGYGACDGTVSCSTCHVIFAEEDFQRLRKAEDEEDDTLDLSPCLTETSRLGCCVELEAWMDGIVVKLPQETRDQRGED